MTDRMGAVAAALIVVCAAGAADARGQSAPRVLETVVVTGGLVPVTFRELPRTVRVVTRDEIERLPVSTAIDLVRLVASADLRARGPRGVQADFSVRGAGFGQVLVLVDGIRFNNAQSGHHNSDLPVTLDEIDRVEVLLGPGSSAFGADAFGGTINIVTRRGASRPRASVVLGQHGLVDAAGAAGGRMGTVQQRVAVQFSRSAGFMFDRDFRTLTVTSRSTLGAATAVTLGVVDKAFGANGYYGPSPSKEWTTSFSAGVERSLVKREHASVSTWLSYRTHRDRFRWDVARPGFFENLHRTHAAEVGIRGRWRPAPATEVGAVVEGAGDWIRSSNLGDRQQGRAAAAFSLQQRVGDATVFEGSLRVDTYSTFGTTASPTAGVSHWLSPAWRLRGSAGRAFRVPTFTERYYRDPAHEARAALDPERAWAADAAVDWLPSASWQGTIGIFTRWERDVIDWVRPTAAEKWRTTNIRHVDVRGVEVGFKRWTPSGASLGMDYTYLATDAGPVVGLSKYVLDYARHSLVLSGTVAAPGGVTIGARLEGRERVGRDPYALVDLRLTRRVAGARVFVEATNLLGATYQEIRGVAMPGRWMTAGVELGR